MNYFDSDMSNRTNMVKNH